MIADPASNTSETVIQFPNGGDPLDSAGKAILGLLQQAAGVAEENNRRALDIAHKLALQLRSAEEQIRELGADVRYYKERVDRAEKWLRQIALEIEQKFLASADNRSDQAPTRQASPQNYAPRKSQRRAWS
ncbi:MAG: hypothetical protein ABSC37_00240 [Xanthobacteraceae bacterium]